MTAEERKTMELLAGTMWRLIEKGYVRTDDEASEAECEHLRDIAMQAVKRAKVCLKLVESGYR